VFAERRGDGLGETVPVDGERAPGRQLMCVAHAHDQRAGATHLGVEQTDRIRFSIVGAE
jgi:hypothetical protein